MGEREQLDHEQPDGPLDNLEDQVEDNSDKATKTGVSTSRDLETLDRTRVNVHSTTLECPDCGRSYPEPPRIVHDVEAAWRSVKSHVQRSHKRKLQRSEVGLPELPSPPVKGKKLKGEAVTIPVIEVEMDDVDKDQLAEMKKRRTLAEEQAKMLEAETVLERMEDRRDDYTPWDRGRRRWDRSNRHDGGTSSLDREDYKQMGKLEAQVEQHKESEETVSSQGETISELMEQMDAKDKLMFEQIRIQNENLNREKDRAHETQLTLLKQMAEDRRSSDNRYHESAMKAMEERLTMRMEMQSRDVETRKMDMAEDGVKTVTSAVKTLGNELRKVSEGARFASGLSRTQPIEDAPSRERMGPSSVADLVGEVDPKHVEIWGPDVVVEDVGTRLMKKDSPRVSTVVDDRNVGEEQ